MLNESKDTTTMRVGSCDHATDFIYRRGHECNEWSFVLGFPEPLHATAGTAPI